jgi:hypothetical protein
MSSRLEPTCRSTGIEEGLAARIHDPLWLLARQWQFGEFEGKDAGTPVVVQATGTNRMVDAWRPLSQPEWAVLDGNKDPLEAFVEAEREPAPTLRERVEAGAHFVRMLNAAGFGKYRAAFASAHAFVPSDLATMDGLFAGIARRTPDATVLRETARALGAGLPQPVDIDQADLDAVRSVSSKWLAWYGDEISTNDKVDAGPATWQEHRMEYGVAVSSAAADGTVLVADRYAGDGLDWFDFDIDPSLISNPGQEDPPKNTQIAVKAIPHPVRFSGMPLPRFWAMEDAECDFGSVDAAPNDVVRLLIVEFATLYSNDWFVLPLKIRAGSLTILDQVTVQDVFGRTFVLGRAGDDNPNWNLFSLSSRGKPHASQKALFLPPVTGHVSESSPVESVRFLRDEMADLAWGVETLYQNELEARVDRRSAWVAPARPKAGSPNLPAYRVETVVPDYWIPLAPEKVDDNGGIHLRMVPLEVDTGDKPALATPKGRILQATDSEGDLWVYDEEIPREGTQVDRLYRYARWIDGRTSLWTARRRRTGRGEGSSGLRFDIIDPDGMPARG